MMCFFGVVLPHFRTISDFFYLPFWHGVKLRILSSSILACIWRKRCWRLIENIAILFSLEESDSRLVLCPGKLLFSAPGTLWFSLIWYADPMLTLAFRFYFCFYNFSRVRLLLFVKKRSQLIFLIVLLPDKILMSWYRLTAIHCKRTGWSFAS